MTVTLSRAENEGVPTQNLFPLYIFLARLVSDVAPTEVKMDMLLFKLD